MADPAHELTEKELASMERRVHRVYAEASKEAAKKLSDFLEKFEKEDNEKKRMALEGKITQEAWLEWRKGRLLTGKHWTEIMNTLSEDMHRSKQIARSIIGEHLPEVYAINHDYSYYQTNADGLGASFTLYDRRTVEKLISEKKLELLPGQTEAEKERRRRKDIVWNRNHIQNALTQGILIGDSVPHLARRLREVAVMNRNASIRYARTMTTNVQNAGRYDGYRDLQAQGVPLTLEWAATLDGRTRHEHRMMHGQRRKVGEPFVLDGIKILYPAQASGEGASDIPQRMIWNCRCTILAWVAGHEHDTRRTSDDVHDFEAWRNAGLKRQTPKKKKTESQGQQEPQKEKKPKQEKQKKQSKPESLEVIERENATVLSLRVDGVESNPCKRLEKPLTEEEIIDKISGGDMTTGSCASAALAYAGNVAGYDIRDFRGGKSMNYFSRRPNSFAMYNTLGVEVAKEKGTNEQKTAEALLKTMLPGHEYILYAGRHASGVRLFDGRYQYLELQHPMKELNGWTDFSDRIAETLKQRFGCRRSRTIYGTKIESTSALVDIKDLQGDDFASILNYINTPESEQKKSEWGSLR